MIPHIETRDRTSLFYKDWGKGQPVVFIHGWALGADMWEYQMPYLTSRGLRCIPYDKRGCGRSSQPWHSYDFDTFADDLAAVIEHLDLREVTLVGHSMGCGDITRYLLRHGAGRVARTALVAPTTPFILKTPDNPEGLDKSMFDSVVAELGRDRPRFLAARSASLFRRRAAKRLCFAGDDPMGGRVVPSSFAESHDRHDSHDVRDRPSSRHARFHRADVDHPRGCGPRRAP
jgi:non-heme chloroperoxidase